MRTLNNTEWGGGGGGGAGGKCSTSLTLPLGPGRSPGAIFVFSYNLFVPGARL